MYHTGAGGKRRTRYVIYASVICIPAKSPGSPEADNNVEQQLEVVLMKTYCERDLKFCM